MPDARSNLTARKSLDQRECRLALCQRLEHHAFDRAVADFVLIVHVLGRLAADLNGIPVRLPADHNEVALVVDRALERDPVDLVVRSRFADLGYDDLDLVRLRAVGEQRSEQLPVPVGEPAGGYVAPVVLEPGRVRIPDAGLAQRLELVVPADRRERDAVVQLAELPQRSRRIGGHEEDAGLAADHDAAADLRDAPAGVVRLVLHHLLR